MRSKHRNIIGFAEHQEKTTYRLGYNLTLTRNSDNSVLNKENATIIGKTKIYSIEWYVPNYKVRITQQAMLSKPILSEVPKEFQNVGKSVFTKEVNIKNFGLLK